MLNRAYFGWIPSYHLCINLVCISIRLCVTSGFSYFLFCSLFFFSWCACICAIIYLFDLLTKRLKHKREVAMYVLFIQSYLTQIAAVLIVLIITPWVSLFTYLFRAFSINLIFQKTACSNHRCIWCRLPWWNTGSVCSALCVGGFLLVKIKCV